MTSYYHRDGAWQSFRIIDYLTGSFIFAHKATKPGQFHHLSHDDAPSEECAGNLSVLFFMYQIPF